MEKIASWLLALFLSLYFSTLTAQTLSAKVLDAVTQEPIAYATVQLKKKGVITNEEGRFNLLIETDFTPTDSLFISYMGYETLGKPIREFTDAVIYLRPQPIELRPVIVSNKNFTADEIMDLVKKNIATNYGKEGSKRRFFFRDSHHQALQKMDYTFVKSTIDELNIPFLDQVLHSLPKSSSYYTEILADLYEHPTEKDHKIEVIRASELYDKNKELDMNALEEKFNAIIKANVKPNSYFKVKSGLFGTKIKGEDFDELYKPEKDSLDAQMLEKELEAQKKKEVERKTNFAKYRKKTVARMLQNQFYLKDAKVNLIQKTRKYEFTLADFTYFGADAVYILDFTPKGSADYRGRIYVNADDFAIIRLDYENIKPIKTFKLLGISMNNYLSKGKMIYAKNDQALYAIRYLEEEFGTHIGVKRPLKIIEVNNHVKGRNKQNELALKLDMATTSTNKHELIIFEHQPISTATYDAFAENNTVLPTYMPNYDPNFWADYSIIEPNKAITEFTSE
ncbi:carboxypeptidase-like regulatory domain-containing protein [Arenibacter sp. GZD96]|uniref:carboxypeptidase-like regulatory domain-containing protein n=1 Tax=Aurantibrevibacter litoralis TaxID=3106030 RepID=UPI002B001F38|nr:carboxypeptidase-like regulatory domain-containing protein [Arenibacter sp. GZD-96]MEA1786405.1 carboxypeptidase-like regulatory domain-containing protein [Arenibacter sp. GZD-96]